MFKLFQYEFRKSLFPKLVFLCITGVFEVVFLIGAFGEKETPTGIGIVGLTFAALAGIAYMGIESILTLYRDLTTKQSYMLFMTPNSCYKILGAKVLECGASILLAGAFFFALGALDITLLFGKMGQLNQLWQTIQSFLTSFTFNGRALEINMQSLSAFTFALLTSWISIITTAYLADVISAALLNGKKHNGIISNPNCFI